MISTSEKIAVAFEVLLCVGCPSAPGDEAGVLDAGRSAPVSGGASEAGDREACIETTGGAPVSGEVFCPSITCANGVTFMTDFAWTFEQARKATFEVCRGDFCLSGMVASHSPAPDGAGSGTGFKLIAPGVTDPADAQGFANVTFFNDEQLALYLDVTWTPRSLADLSAGDHYRVSMTLDDKTSVLIDEVVDYAINDIGRPECPCYHHCLRAEIDRRRRG